MNKKALIVIAVMCLIAILAACNHHNSNSISSPHGSPVKSMVPDGHGYSDFNLTCETETPITPEIEPVAYPVEPVIGLRRVRTVTPGGMTVFIFEIFVRSFFDSDGDGIGVLNGIYRETGLPQRWRSENDHRPWHYRDLVDADFPFALLPRL